MASRLHAVTIPRTDDQHLEIAYLVVDLDTLVFGVQASWEVALLLHEFDTAILGAPVLRVV